MTWLIYLGVGRQEREGSRLFQQCTLSEETCVCKTGSHSSVLCPIQSVGTDGTRPSVSDPQKNRGLGG